MEELGITSSHMHEVLTGGKTIEARLGKPRYIKLRVGNKLSLREDIDSSDNTDEPVQVTAVITQLLYFSSFDEMFSAVSYLEVDPDAASIEDALLRLHEEYSEADEEEYGVIAIRFALEA